jgi:hypothetical protein
MKRRNYKKELEELQAKNASLEINHRSALETCSKLSLEVAKNMREAQKMRADAEKLWWLIFDLNSIFMEKIYAGGEGQNNNLMDFMFHKSAVANTIFTKDINGGCTLDTPEEKKQKAEDFDKMMRNLSKQPLQYYPTNNGCAENQTPK